jgi:tetratricopeptide (TPR) repeat protein
MKKQFVCICLALAAGARISGQDNIATKSAISEFNKGEKEKAIKMMRKEIERSNQESDWDVLVKMYQERMNALQEDPVAKAGAAALTNSEDKEEKKKKGGLTYAEAEKDLIGAAKEATRMSQSATASALVRIYLVDYLPDSAVSDEAKKSFKEGEAAFGKKDYKGAVEAYRKAVAKSPEYFKATIYLGDAYWYLEQMDSAEFYFRKGIARCPDLLEPRKYLVDVLTAAKKNEEAKKACIDAICIYPDISMFAKYQKLLRLDGMRLDMHWMPRDFELNACGEQKAIKDKNWKLYRDAKKDVESFCTKGGVLSANSVTKQKYLEVYCWEKMLKGSDKLPPEFDFAKQMMQEGYLDCYLFICLFHQENYPQYVDFVKNNKQRVKEFMEKYIGV